MRLSVVLAAWLLGLCGASKGRAWFSLLAGRAEEKTAAEEPGRAFLSLAEHDAQVAVLCSAIGAAPPGTQLSIRRKPAESHCARPHNYKRNTLSLDMSRFTSVLGVAPLHIPTDLPLHLRGTLAGTQVCIVVDVQAMCSFEALVDVLLPLGLIPAVVPEFKGITVGGSLQGLAAESTSFKFGYVHDCIVGFEAVLGDGRVVWCTDSNQHADLFRALPGSFGSLAICTRIRMLCLPAAPLVQCRIQHWASADECLERLSAIQAGGRAKATGKYAANGSDKGASTSGEGAASGKSWPDFAEGIGYSEGSFATIEGRFVTADADAASSVGAAAEAAAPLSSSSTSSSFLPSWLRAGTVRLNGRPHTLARCGRWGHDWFYSQVRAALPPVRVGEASLLLPTKDYLFRHDHGSFWMASYRIPQPVGRYMGSLLDNASMFRLANLLPWAFPKSQIVLQDFLLPFRSVGAFFAAMQGVVKLWPVWMLPMRNFEAAGRPGGVKQRELGPVGAIFGTPQGETGDFCNIGAYGIPSSAYSFEPANRQLEALLSEHGGRKVLYSHAFYSRQDFYSRLYDGARYFRMRERYCAAPLPEMFDKVVTTSGQL